jgi:hypothetical protein
MRRAGWVALGAAVVVAVLVLVATFLLVGSGSEPAPRSAPRPPQSAGPSEPPSSQPSSPEPSTSPETSCADVQRAFAPRSISVPGVTNASVVAPPRDAYGIPGVPPLTNDGKVVFAWDREQGIRPGDPGGNVLLNAHTWPDGTALGNRLLAGLQPGDRIVVRGVDTRLCYRVTERVEVPAQRRMLRYYETEGPHQLAIVVCSGRRLGPGLWEKRTVWFASPSV